MKFYINKEMLAQFVAELLVISNIDWQSITITNLEKSGVYCVSIATSTLSVDTARKLGRICYRLRTRTLQASTQDGLYRRKHVNGNGGRDE